MWGRVAFLLLHEDATVFFFAKLLKKNRLWFVCLVKPLSWDRKRESRQSLMWGCGSSGVTGPWICSLGIQIHITQRGLLRRKQMMFLFVGCNKTAMTIDLRVAYNVCKAKQTVPMKLSSYFDINQTRVSDTEAKKNAICRSWKCHSTDEEDDQYHIRYCGCDVHHLQTQKCIQTFVIVYMFSN